MSCRTGFAEQTHDTASRPTVYPDRPVLFHHGRNARCENSTKAIPEGGLKSSGSTHDHDGRFRRAQSQRADRGRQFIRIGDSHRGRGTRIGQLNPEC